MTVRQRRRPFLLGSRYGPILRETVRGVAETTISSVKAEVTNCGGFIKEAIAGLRRTTGTRSSAITAYKKVVDQQVFVYPRLVPFISPDEPYDDLQTLERPLRGQTAQGERVTLVKSDMIQPGALLSFELHIFKGKVTENVVKEVLAYGIRKGLGQWRSGGYGQFVVVSFERLEAPLLSPYDLPSGILP